MLIVDLNYAEKIAEKSALQGRGLTVQINWISSRQAALSYAQALAYGGDARANAGAFNFGDFGQFFK